MAVERRKPLKPKITRGRRTPKRAAAELVIEQRRVKVTQLRTAGWSIREIAAHLKCGLATVQADLDTVLLRVQDEAGDNVRRERAISVSRIEQATKGLWPAVTNGNPEAVRAFARIDERKAKLLGLDAASRHELSGPGGGPVEVAPKKSLLEQKLDDLAARLAGGESQPRGTAGTEPGSSG